jgi:hypothetical protein
MRLADILLIKHLCSDRWHGLGGALARRGLDNQYHLFEILSSS